MPEKLREIVSRYDEITRQMELPESEAHIGGFEMEQCQRLIQLCRRDGRVIP